MFMWLSCVTLLLMRPFLLSHHLKDMQAMEVSLSTLIELIIVTLPTLVFKKNPWGESNYNILHGWGPSSKWDHQTTIQLTYINLSDSHSSWKMSLAWISWQWYGHLHWTKPLENQIDSLFDQMAAVAKPLSSTLTKISLTLWLFMSLNHHILFWIYNSNQESAVT